MHMSLESTYLRAAGIIDGADAIIIAAGAGIGVDSGLPDFRSSNGFWKAYPALAAAQLNFTEVASPRTFEKYPRLAWGFYGHRLKMYRETAPHEGFAIMKQWADAVPLGAWVFTSNVDGAFQRSGFSEEQIHECHGSIHWLQCMDDCQSELWPSDEFIPDVDAERCQLLSTLPICHHCGGLARPNILMFGDWNWNQTHSEVQRRQERRWLETLACSGCNVAIVEVGAGSAIPSVRHFSHRMSQEYGGRIVRINPREFEVPSSLDVGIPMGSLAALKGISKAMQVLRANNESKPEGI
jgi:NAD-dependent SIR2 family protein deacetylase